MNGAELLTAVGLGALQGATEFLPVSSSGHLVLATSLAGLDEASILPLTILLHLATILAVLLYFRREVGDMALALLTPGRAPAAGRRMLLLVLAGSIPTAAVGLLLKGPLERLFAAPLFVVFGLTLTGAALWAAERLSRPREGRPLSVWGALLVGAAQGAAIAPGISRSGATIGAALALGAPREEAFAFSFLLSLPATAGAALLEVDALRALPPGAILYGAAGMATAFAVGWGSLALLSRWVRDGRLRRFAVYCWCLAAAALVHFGKVT